MGKLYCVMRGIRQTKNAISGNRLHIMPFHLQEMLRFINNSCFSSSDKAMGQCLILFAFFGLLGVFECFVLLKNFLIPIFTCPHLSLVFHLTTIFLTWLSKALRWIPRKTFQIPFGRINGVFCPVEAFCNTLHTAVLTWALVLFFKMGTLSIEN